MGRLAVCRVVETVGLGCGLTQFSLADSVTGLTNCPICPRTDLCDNKGPTSACAGLNHSPRTREREREREATCEMQTLPPSSPVCLSTLQPHISQLLHSYGRPTISQASKLVPAVISILHGARRQLLEVRACGCVIT